jgi:PAS domain S-box-containing protein
MITELIYHSAFLIVLSVAYGFLYRLRCSSISVCRIAEGILFGGIALIAMKGTVHHHTGFIYDGRSIVLAMAGLFGGAIPAGIAVAAAGIYRYTLGGAGVWAGELTIVTTALAGLVCRHRIRQSPHRLSLWSLFLFGAGVHVLMLCCQLVAPEGGQLVRQLWLPVMAVLPAATAGMGYLMASEMRKAEAEKALLQSEENFRRSLDESPFGMYIVSNEGKTLYANPAFLSLHGYDTIAGFEGSPSESRYTPESYRAHEERKEKRRKGEYVEPEYDIEIIRTDGERRCVHVYRKKIFWSGVPQSLAIYHDISVRVKMMTDLQAAKDRAEESARLKSAFLSNMSHGIRTPLNVILGFSEMLASREELGPATAAEYSGIIRLHSEELLQTLSNIIDISKLETGQMQLYPATVNVTVLLADLQKRYARRLAETGKGHIGLSVSLPEGPLMVSTDKEKLNRIFYNLLDNAVRCTEGGSIRFGLEKAGADRLSFFVSDTGPGIPDEAREIIFDSFRAAAVSPTKVVRGAGVGLPVVKRLTELLGGELVLQSELGKGTVVRFCLPVKEDI